MASVNPSEIAKKKIDEAIKNGKTRDEQANKAIWAATLICAGMGAVPFGINIWAFSGVAVTMVIALSAIYEQKLSKESAARLIKQVFTAVGWTWFASVLGLKFFAEVLKGIGVITIGGTTVAGMILDAVLGGAVCFALGYTVKEYLKKNGSMTKKQMKDLFKAQFEKGKTEIKNVKK